jgi:hypothetical protein
MPGFSRGDCAPYRAELGVYVLGAIGPAERAQVDQHLADCARCRDELAGLAGLPGLLRRVPADLALRALTDASGDAPPGTNLDRLISRISAIRIRRRFMAIAAAVLIGIAAATGLHVLQGSPASTATTAPRWTDTDTGTSAATGAGATVRYAAERWGTEVEVRVTGVRAGTRCQLRVINAQGQGVAAGGWVIRTGSEYTWYPASVPWSPASLSSFVITSGTRTLVTVTAQ